VKALAHMYKIFLGRASLDPSVTPDFLRAHLAHLGHKDDAQPAFYIAKCQFFEVLPLSVRKFAFKRPAA
jgi:hypothetical protein